MPFKLGYELQEVRLGAATPKDVYPRDIMAALDKLEYGRKFITIFENEEEFQNLNSKSHYDPLTEATSELKAGEMCTGLVDPDAPQQPREIHPHFKAGVFGFHVRNSPKLLSRH